MIDTGATNGNFINITTAQLLKERESLPLVELDRRVTMEGYNGTQNVINWAVYPRLTIDNHTSDNVCFYVCDMPTDLILGKSWMNSHGLLLHMGYDKVAFAQGWCDHDGAPGKKQLQLDDQYFQYLEEDFPTQQSPSRLVSQILKKGENPEALVWHIPPKKSEHFAPSIREESSDESEAIKPQTLFPKDIRRHTREIDYKDEIRKMNDELQELTNKLPKTTSNKLENKPKKQEVINPKISCHMIGAQPFLAAAKQQGASVFAVSLKEVLEEKSKREKPDYTREELLNLLPEDLKEFVDVFVRSRSNKLPPHRSSDHHIDTPENVKLPKGKLYRMSHDELEVCRRYIEENLSKGFIEASSAPWASPVLFVKKPGGGIRFCVDYRTLNGLTKKDSFPLPLVDETLANLHGATALTKLDIIAAFNRIRMQTERDEELTSFKTTFGTFKYKVMPFGLCNGPATWQRFMNEILWDHIGKTCMVYMDDILIYSKDKKEHKKHVRQILRILGEHDLQCDIDKCEFDVTETKFLGMVVTTEGIRMDPAKVKAIIEWETPKCARDVVSFRSFCNFYRRFIAGFSKLFRPLQQLEKKESFQWNDQYKDIFEYIKHKCVTSPVLYHWDRTKMNYVETDASDEVVAGVLSQMDDSGVLHPVAFFSKKMSPAECNYQIYDKELLAIIRAFEDWKPELMGSQHPIQVITDHKNLEWFMTTKKLTRRQARWAEFLSQFHFKITYRPGKLNTIPDTLTRRTQDMSKDESDERKKHNHQTVLPNDKIHPEIKREIEESLDKGKITLSQVVTLTEIDVDEGPDFQLQLQQNGDQLRQEILTVQGTDSTCASIVKSLREGDRLSKYISLVHCSLDNDGLLRYKGKAWIPQEPEELRTKVIEMIHDHPTVGHAGIAKTFTHLDRLFYWPRMDKTVKRYVSNCMDCRRAKSSRKKYQGLLNPLPIPDQPWKHISLDFVTGLPMSNGFNAVCVVVCRLTKERHFIPCLAGNEQTTAQATAKMLFKRVYVLHGIPDSMVSDRGPQFIAEVFQELNRLLKIQNNYSTANHPQSDGQTEIANAEMERYLRTFCAYMQDDWEEHLGLAEFAINANVSETTGISPFFASRGYDPRMVFDIRPRLAPDSNIDSPNKELAIKMAKRLRDIWEFLKNETRLSQARMEHFANNKRATAPAYQPNDKVFLNAKHLKTARPSKKLDHKNFGPYTIKRRVGVASYELVLPKTMKVHPVFHTSLLTPYPDDPLPGQKQHYGDPVVIDGEEEWEVEQIEDSRWKDGQLEYRVQWVGYPPDPDFYPKSNFDNSTRELQRFHKAYPTRPGGSKDPLKRTKGYVT